MTLKLRTISFITPIFIGISVFLGLLKYNTEKREIEWGLEEYASSLGESIAQFVPQEEVRFHFFKSKNQRIEKFQEIAFWNPKFKSLWLIQKPEQKVRKLVLGTNLGNELKPIRIDDFDLSIGSRYDHMLISYPSQDPGIDWGLVIDIGEDKNKVKQSMIECFIFGFIISLFGVLISLFIAGILRRNLFYLNQGAKKVIAGDYKQIVSKKSNIQEMIDLGNTFDTMRNVLADFLERIQRRSLGEKIASGSLNLPSKNYNAIFWKNKEEKWSGLTVNLEFINMSSFAFNRDFGSMFASEGKRFAFIGRIAKEDNEFYRNVSTSLIKILFENSLSRGLTVEEAFIEIKKMFKLNRFFCLEHSNRATNLYYLNEKNNLAAETLDFSSKKIHHFHTFAPEVGRTLDKVVFYIKYPYSSTLQLFIKQVTNESGAVLLLSSK